MLDKKSKKDNVTQEGLITDIVLEHLFDRVPTMIGIYSLITGEYVYVNKAVTKLLGYTPKEFISRGVEFVMSLVHPDDLPGVMKKNNAALKKVLRAKPNTADKEPIVNFEYRLKHKNGNWVWFHTDVSIYDWTPDGKVSHLMNASLDITERKNSELQIRQTARDLEKRVQEESTRLNHALDESEKRYRAFIENSNEGIWRCELEKPLAVTVTLKDQIKHFYKYGYLAEANDAMAKMYGMETSDSLVGLRLKELLIESDPNNTAFLAAFIKSNYRLSGLESHELDKDGKDKYFRNSLVGVVEGGKLTRAWGTQQDVTDQHKAIKALKASEDRLALAMQVSQMGVWEWNIETGELSWPPELKRLFGLEPKEEITYEKYQSMLHPLDRKRILATIKSALKTGDSYQVDHRVLWPDGSIHWLHGQGQAFFRKGKAVRMLGTTRNIDHKISTEEALRESEQRYKSIADQQEALVELNEAKDEFITLASHQLRTPATGVKQFLGMLLDNYFGEPTEDQRTMLEYAYESNERQLEVINDLLKVAQVDAGKVVLSKQKTDVASLLEDILQEQRSQFARRKQKVVLDRPEEKVVAVVDRSRIRMVVENLTDNASKYTPNGKAITVSIDKVEDDKFIEIKVKDEGVGIAKEDMPKLFQKFSRLDNPLSIEVGGTGIGLYWAKKIVDLHGGEVFIKSLVGKGTTFTVRIPA